MSFKIFLLVCLVPESYSDVRDNRRQLIGLRPVKRIVGGENAHPNRFPYLVSIQVRKREPHGHTENHNCVGGIIDARWILTAAHCFDGKHTLLVKAGKYDLSKKEEHEQVVRAKSFIRHPQYDHQSMTNDVALVLLEHPLSLNAYVAKIDLPAGDSEPTGTGTLAGWGSTSTHKGAPISPILQSVSMSIISHKACHELAKHKVKIHGSQMCTKEPHGGIGGCAGDSGGPFVVEKEGGRKEVVGIFSWSPDPCGHKDAPDVFSRVSSYINFIHFAMDKFKHVKTPQVKSLSEDYI